MWKELTGRDKIPPHIQKLLDHLQSVDDINPEEYSTSVTKHDLEETIPRVVAEILAGTPTVSNYPKVISQILKEPQA